MLHDARPEAVVISHDATGNPYLYAVPLAAADLYAAGGRWTTLRAPDDPQTAGILRSIIFPTSAVGYVWSMDGLLLKTDDGGRIWRFLRHDLPTIHAIMSFPNSTIGYLGVRRVLLQAPDGRTAPPEASWTLSTPQTLLSTSDGGQTWDLLTPLVDAPLPRYNRAFLPHSASYDVAAVMTQLQSGHESEQTPQGLPGTVGYLRQVVFPTVEVGYALVLVDGLPPSAARVLLQTEDSGQTWRVVLTRAQLVTAPSYPWSLAFPLPDIGYVLLREKLLYTADRGTTWEERPYPSGLSVSDMIFPTASTGYLLGTVTIDNSRQHNLTRKKVMLRTEDGGRNWQQVERGDAEWPLACPRPDIVLAGGSGGVVRRSADGGRMWREVASGTPHRLLALTCPDQETCYGTAGDATIIKSSDGGQSWQVLTTGIDALYAMIGAAI